MVSAKFAVVIVLNCFFKFGLTLLLFCFFECDAFKLLDDDDDDCCVVVVVSLKSIDISREKRFFKLFVRM